MLHCLEGAERSLLMVKTFEWVFFSPKYSLMITIGLFTSLVKLFHLPLKSFILMSRIYFACLFSVFIVMDVSYFVFRISSIGNYVSMQIFHSKCFDSTKFRLMMPNTTLWMSVWLHQIASFSVGSIESYQNKSRIISPIALQ